MPPRPPEPLIRYIRERRCVLFCGSGLSAWAKLPTWKQLLEGMVKELRDDMQDNTDLDEVEKLLAAGKLLETADYCRDALKQRYHTILSEKLRGATEEIPEPHKIIVQLPFAGIVTTNYDKLLERSFATVSSWPKTPTQLNIGTLGPLLFQGAPFIFKAHGDIDDPKSLVLTAGDYQKLMHANDAAAAFFSAILLTKAILFVGYSLNDPDFRLLLDRQLTLFEGNVPERYALMSGVGKVEREILSRTAGIRVLPYDEGKHEQVLDFLRDLHDRVLGAPPSALAAAQEAPAQVTPQAYPIGKNVSVVAMQFKAQALEVSITTGDVVVQGTASAPSWPLMAKLMPGSLHEKNARVIGKVLSRSLPDPVLSALGQISKDRTIALQLPAELELLPWEWIVVNDEFLVLRNAVVRLPSVSNSARGYPIIRDPVQVLLIGDPNQNDPSIPRLPGALSEVQDIERIYSKLPGAVCKSLVGPNATFDNFATECVSGKYDIMHFAGHAWYDDEVYLVLANGVKLHTSEFRSLLSSTPPAILFLNTHYTLFMPPGASADVASTGPQTTGPRAVGHRGFLQAASSAGVGTLIGTFCGNLGDLVAQHVGRGFHQQLLQGASVSKALHEALIAPVPEEAKNFEGLLSYGISGYADIVLPTKADRVLGEP